MEVPQEVGEGVRQKKLVRVVPSKLRNILFWPGMLNPPQLSHKFTYTTTTPKTPMCRVSGEETDIRHCPNNVQSFSRGQWTEREKKDVPDHIALMQMSWSGK